MKRELDPYRIVLIALPVLVLAAYTWFVWGTYSSFFNWRFEFQPPIRPIAPEDNFPFGFTVPWIAFSIAFVIAFIPSLFALRRRLLMGSTFLALFATLSAVDFFCYRAVIRHLLA